MYIPGLPGFDTLNELKVKRVSTGPFMFSKIYDNISLLTEAIIADKNFSPILT